MADEVVQWLRPESCEVIFDGTFGAGGHSIALARRVAPGGVVLAVDRDPAAVESGTQMLSDDAALAALPIEVYCGSYHRLDRLLKAAGRPAVDGVVLDLGLSSDQLADRERGFSFSNDGPLDLRFDPSSGQTATQFLASANERDIADAIYQFGEERFSRRIAKQVVLRRQARQPVRTVGELVEICQRCVPRGKHHDIHPATRTFQALRIMVNQELSILEDALRSIPAMVNPGGRIAIISFHSLEDRLVKQAFRDNPRLEVLTRKPLRPTEAEVAANPRSRSAKMRVAQVLDEAGQDGRRQVTTYSESDSDSDSTADDD
jgi:16S rRNA (cytosine1402-N4)-methyltransferase